MTIPGIGQKGRRCLPPGMTEKTENVLPRQEKTVRIVPETETETGRGGTCGV